VHPQVGALAQLAVELRRLREAAGRPSYRALARQANYSPTMLSEAASGRRLPTLEVTLAYVQACGGDEQQWRRRWQAAAAQFVGAEGSPPRRPAPYLGLTAFQPEDAQRFFGRQAAIDDVLGRLERRRWLGVFGVSGSGKSSLLRAGVLPVLRARGVHVPLITPGAHPARHELHPPAQAGRQVVIVDQFEELFTVCINEEERADFIRRLLDLSRAGPGSGVLLAMRADFYPRCGDYPALAAELADGQLLLPQLTVGELRQAIVEPAKRAGAAVEPALVEAVLADVVGRAGALPLMSHTLRETWQRGTGRKMTLANYRAAGGVGGAVAQTAEAAYRDLTPRRRDRARQILLRLIAVDNDGLPSSRRTDPDELGAGGPHASDSVLDRLVAARLVVRAGSGVELAHEALIEAWPRLAGWVEEDLARLRLHRQLTEAATGWERLGRDAGALYRGMRLAAADEAGQDQRWRAGLNALEGQFLDASRDAAEAETAAERRRSRQLRRLVATLSGMLAVALALTGVTVQQRRQADRDRQVALSRQLSATAETLRGSDPPTAALLSIEAYRAAPTPEARGSLLSSAAALAYQAALTGHTDRVTDVAFHPDGKLLASASADQTVQLWDPQRRRRLTVLTGPRAAVNTLTFSRDGHRLAAGDDSGATYVWDTANWRPPERLIVHNGPVLAVAFSPDGRVLASAGNDGTAVLTSAGHDRRLTVPGHPPALINSLAFNPDGTRLAAATKAGSVVLWDAASGRPAAVLTVPTGQAHSVRYSPDGRLLAIGSAGGTITLLDARDQHTLAVLAGHGGLVSQVAFSPDGTRLVSAAQDQTAILWDVNTRTRLTTLAGWKGFAYAAGFSPDGHTLAIGSEDHRVSLWDLSRLPLTAHSDWVLDLAFSPDGRLLASASRDRRVLIWDLARRAPVAELRHADGVNALTISPDGHTLAAATGTRAGGGRQIVLWNLRRRRPSLLLTAHRDLVTSVAFSPDGSLLASGSVDRTVILWQLHQGRPARTLTGHTARVNTLAFSPDGHLLATAGRDQTILIWDVTTGERRATRTGHTGPIRSLAFSPDGSLLASTGVDSTVRLWRTPDFQPAGVINSHGETLDTLAFSPDGHTLAAGGDTGTVLLLDPRRGTRIATLTGHTRPLHALAFTPDSIQLATAGEDPGINLWPLDPTTATTRICTTLTDDLTPEQWQALLPDHPYHPTCGS
jgi:WD40 repeat protein